MEDEGYALWTPVTHENEHIFAQLDEPSSESVWLETVDGKQMQCWVLYPPHFDPSKQYPGIEIVLGGPQGTNSQDWSYRWCYRLMAQQGYVVIMPNRRGTTAFGQEWKEQISGDYPGLNMQDYLTAGRWLKSRDYIGKLACVGASYGGYSVYMLEGLHGDLYDCFIAHAGIFDEKMLWYTTEEMWFANWDYGGAPWDKNPNKSYTDSPHKSITKWNTPILVIHNEYDFRIPVTQGMQAFNAARMRGVPAKFLYFPDECHWVTKPQNGVLWQRVFFDWLDKYLK